MRVSERTNEAMEKYHIYEEIGKGKFSQVSHASSVLWCLGVRCDVCYLRFGADLQGA